ncbi:MAG: sugar ABC transporter permease, partial [Caldicoprobacterales bacterium]
VGLENYMYLLKDDWFWQSISNTIKLGLMSSIPQHILALILAFILNSQLVKFSKVYRTAYFMPYITSTVAVALVFQIIFGTRYGVMNYLLTPLRDYNWFQQLLTWLDLTFPIEWLGRVHTIKPTLAMLTIWRWTGWNMVLYLAGLQSIPHEIYESAKVDGASNWDLFWRISLPLLRPMMTFAVTMSVIGSMQAFDEPMVILGTGGGVGRAGKTTVLYLYQTSF